MLPVIVEDILARLVEFPSVVGTQNAPIVRWIADYCRANNAQVSVLAGPEGDRANLFATIGPQDRSGYVLSGHTDVVPATEAGWSSDPFVLRADGERLHGRGTTDMKGFLACALAALPKIAAMTLSQPVHLAFSYDEEAGCRGVPHLIAALPELCAKPAGAIIGEPSRMQAVRGHKGKAAARLDVIGKTGHSSRPDQGLNAVHALAGVISRAVAHGDGLRAGPLDASFEPPYSTLQVGVVVGGRAVNIIPDHCYAELEARAIPGASPVALLETVKADLEALASQGYAVQWRQLSDYPALSLAADAPLATLMHELTGVDPLAAVSYGTEAGLFQQAGIASIICGPGDIGRAHKPDEFIERAELHACQQMIETLAARLAA